MICRELRDRGDEGDECATFDLHNHGHFNAGGVPHPTQLNCLSVQGPERRAEQGRLGCAGCPAAGAADLTVLVSCRRFPLEGSAHLEPLQSTAGGAEEGAGPACTGLD